MGMTMELSQETLETIGNYVRRNLRNWFDETVEQSYAARDLELRERMIRVEEELKVRGELMVRGFEQIDRRFELVDRRFEQVEKRFEQIDKRFDLVEKRFEQVDKRFEQVDRRFAEQREDTNTRFDDLHRHMNRWMTVVTIIVTLVSAAGILVNLIA